MSEPVPASSGRNRRLSKRRPPKGKARVTCRRGALDLGPDLALAVLDLSEWGARLLVRESLDPGREVLILLRGEANSRPVRRVGDVVWSLAAADGAYCIGVRFQKRVPYGDFSQLTLESTPRVPGQPPSPGPSPAGGGDALARRRSVRRAGQRLLSCRLSVATGRPDLDAMVLDVSERGVGLMAAGPLRAGEAVALRLRAAGSGRPALDLPARIVYGVGLNLGGFLLGAEFVRPLSGEQLAAVLSRMGHAAAHDSSAREQGGRPGQGRAPAEAAKD